MEANSPVPPAGGTPPALDPATLKSALKAFRKRLKITRLDDESGLGPRALTGGRRSGIVGIAPPAQFPREVWEALVQQGKLRRLGPNSYELADE